MANQHRLVLAAATIILILSGSSSGRAQDVSTAKACFDKGMLFREAGDPRSFDAIKQAEKDLDGYIVASRNDAPGLVAAYTLRARCRNLLGNNGQAIRDLDRAIELSTDNADLYYLRSFIHDIMGDAEQSLADLKVAAQTGNRKAQDELTSKRIPW